MRANGEPPPPWRERFAEHIEAGKQEWAEHVNHLDEEKAAYEERLRQSKRIKGLYKNSFRRDEPSHADLSQPKEDDDIW